MTDITNRKDIELLVDEFYKKVLKDQVISPVFNAAVFDWDAHIPVMYSFWDSVLLHAASYQGNVMLKHISLNKKTALTPEHFDRWILLWDATIDALFEGPIASDAKEKAINMKRLMLFKIEQSNKPGFIQ